MTAIRPSSFATTLLGILLGGMCLGETNIVGQDGQQAAAAQNLRTAWIEDLGGRFQVNDAGEVTRVILQRSWVTDADLGKLAQCAELEEIDLSYTKITDLGLEQLIPLQNVRVLNLRYAENVTDLGIAHLKYWPQLRSLDVRGTKVTSSLFEHVIEFKQLEFLDVGFSRVNDDLFEKLATLEQLRHFGFGGNKMSGSALPLLKLLPGLRVLDMAGEQRTDSGLWSVSVTDFNVGEIAQLEQLQQLDLSDANLTDRGVAQLAALTNLASLNLSGTRVSARGLEMLARMPELRRLQLRRCRGVNDQAAPFLARMKGLQVLELQETNLTADGVLRLAELAQLQQLNLGGLEIPVEIIEQLRARLPNCTITHWESPTRQVGGRGE